MPPVAQPDSASSILFRSEDGGVFVIDIPRSIEEAQVLPGHAPARRLLSAKPLSAPFPTPEPRDADARRHDQAPAALLSDLMTGATVGRALETVKAAHHGGPFCLSRLTVAATSEETKPDPAILPEQSVSFQGTIEEKKQEFDKTSPVFDLILLDPPWPNRSAKRKRGGYQTLGGLSETRELLSQIPVPAHLAADGLVAIWITNKPSLNDLLVAPGNGLLSEWGLEVAAEWTWLKITSEGEPMYSLESTWRKPWERLIVARKAGSTVKVPERVLLAVPDLHSRKPALRGLFADVLPPAYRGLEVFARNLTAGWWSWGNEVLRFQQASCWAPIDNNSDGEKAAPEGEGRADREIDQSNDH